MTESKLSYPLDCKRSKHRRLNWLDLHNWGGKGKEYLGEVWKRRLQMEMVEIVHFHGPTSSSLRLEMQRKCISSECVSPDWGSVSTILNWRSQGSTIPWQQVACRDIRMSLLRGLEARRCLFEGLLEFLCLLCVTKTKTIQRNSRTRGEV